MRLAYVARDLVTESTRPALDADRIGSLVQVTMRSLGDNDGNSAASRVVVDRASFVHELGGEFVDLVPAIKEPHAALRAAITRSGRTSLNRVDGKDAGNLRWVRIGVNDAGVLSYGLLHFSAQTVTASIDSRQIATLSVDKSGILSQDFTTWTTRADILTSAHNEVMDARNRYEEQRRNLQSDDLRRFVNKVLTSLKCVAVGGSLKLVPVDGDARLLDIESALQLAGYGLFFQPINDGGHLVADVERGLLVEVEALGKEVAALINKDNTTKKSFGTRLALCQDLRARASVFADLVGIATETITNAVDNIDDLLRKTINELA